MYKRQVFTPGSIGLRFASAVSRSSHSRTGYACKQGSSAVVTILAVGTYHETRYRDLAADPGVNSAAR